MGREELLLGHRNGRRPWQCDYASMVAQGCRLEKFGVGFAWLWGTRVRGAGFRTGCVTIYLAGEWLSPADYFVIQIFYLRVAKTINAFPFGKLGEYFMKISGHGFHDFFNNFFRSSRAAIVWESINLRFHDFREKWESQRWMLREIG